MGRGIPGCPALGRFGSRRGVFLAALNIPTTVGRTVGYNRPFLCVFPPSDKSAFPL